MEINARVQAVNKFYFGLKKLLRSRLIYEFTGDWRIRKNKEHQELHQRPSIEEDITKRRLMWEG